jgi:hypothetical protein
MSRILIQLLLASALLCPWPTQAAPPQVGDRVEGGVFLYREAVERYWNDWVGFPLMTDTASATRQARLTIVGEGKTALFIGNLSINCESGKSFWESAGSHSEFLSSEEDARKLVPAPALRNAVRLFCE